MFGGHSVEGMVDIRRCVILISQSEAIPGQAKKGSRPIMVGINSGFKQLALALASLDLSHCQHIRRTVHGQLQMNTSNR